MFKGTTPTHTFEVDIDTSVIKTVKITYTQKDKEILVKRTDDCEIGNGVITTSLSQEDTFLFKEDTWVRVQLRILTNSGEALASAPMMITVGACLDDEVLE